ncbi:hypothetical protein [Streptomyces sp. NPDC059166]|uniref:hypothetical protein n=1 Tax=Streptomyces sp. NPDC059166 TaxID=3346752 RepID=UPI0036D14B69
MNLRSLSLVLIALLSTAGCVSVQPETVRPAPAADPRSGAAAATSAPPVAPPAAHDSLGTSEERPAHGRAGRREEAERGSGPARQAEEAAPPARRAIRGAPRVQAPPYQVPRRADRPRARLPRPPHDMRSVCATGRGVASADVVDLCRAAYGR